MNRLVPEVRRFTNVCNINNNNKIIAVFMCSKLHIRLTLHSHFPADQIRFNVEDYLL